MTKNYTLGEVALIENITGYKMDEEEQPMGKKMAAQILVIKKREVMKLRAAGKTIPDFTLEDAYNMDSEEAGSLILRFLGYKLDDKGQPIFKYDEEGNKLLDENGNPVMVKEDESGDD